MATPGETVTSIGSAWCPCGKHKASEQIVCFACFVGLPMVVKYGLVSLRLEIRMKAQAAAIKHARDEEPFRKRELEIDSGELFK